jgi:hypothetical protein
MQLRSVEVPADSELASPTFIIPKKDNTIRVVSDFREINKQIVRKPFPISLSEKTHFYGHFSPFC